MPEERHFRAFARRAMTLPGALGDPVGGARTVQIVNLGLGGACVEIRDEGALAPLAPGASVTLDLTAPGLWDPLHVTARVAWVAPSGANVVRAGLAFDYASSVPSALIELLGSFR